MINFTNYVGVSLKAVYYLFITQIVVSVLAGTIILTAKCNGWHFDMSLSKRWEKKQK